MGTMRVKEEEYCDSESSKPYHPFSEFIMATPLPESFKIPQIEPYDGSTDPENHLRLFNVHMLINGSSSTDSINCRVFPSTLKDHALRWFSTLPPNSIENFSQLKSKFLSHFALSKVFPKSHVGLINVKQLDHELLKDYLKRFNQHALQVNGLNPKLYIYHIMQGLKSGPFSKSLALTIPSNLNELWERAQLFVDSEIQELHEKNKRRKY